jgi:alkylresorcinol/alkylpyrone synthase
VTRIWLCLPRCHSDVLGANLADPPAARSIALMIAMGPAFCSELVLLRW